MIFANKISHGTIVLLLFAGITCFFPFSVQAKEKADLAGVKMSFEKPDPKVWKITREEYFPDRQTGIILYTHVPVYNKEKQAITPTIGIVYEKFAEPPEDALVYSINMRMRMSFEPKGVLTHQDGSLTDIHAIGYTTVKEQDKIKHSLIIVHILCGKVGVQIICDSTSDVMDQVEPDMRKFIKSVILSEK